MNDTRPCTCPPDERPYPCRHQYALGLCRKAEIRALREEVKQLHQDERDGIEYRRVLAEECDKLQERAERAEAERDALRALLEEDRDFPNAGDAQAFLEWRRDWCKRRDAALGSKHD